MKTDIEYFLMGLFHEIVSEEAYLLCVESTLFNDYFDRSEELHYSLGQDLYEAQYAGKIS